MAARAGRLLNIPYRSSRLQIFHGVLPTQDPVRRLLGRVAKGESSVVSEHVRLAQAHRIRGRLSVAQSYVASAQLARAMSSKEGKTAAEGVESVPSPTKSFDTYLPMITSALDRLTTSANALPTTRSDINFHRTMDRQFANDLDQASERVLKMTERLLIMVEVGQEEAKGKGKGKEVKVGTKAGASTKTRMKLEDEDDVVDGYKRGVLSVVDGLLEDAVRPLSHDRQDLAKVISLTRTRTLVWTISAVNARRLPSTFQPTSLPPPEQRYVHYRRRNKTIGQSS